MKINIDDITSGKMNSEYVWICDYRPSKTGIHAKPVRHVKPQKVLVVDRFYVNKTIYYSDSCFLPLGRNHKPLKSKSIAVFDNTGYRTYKGVPVRVFDNEQECIDQYKEFEKVFNPVVKRTYSEADIIKAVNEWSCVDIEIEEINSLIDNK